MNVVHQEVHLMRIREILGPGIGLCTNRFKHPEADHVLSSITKEPS